MNVLKGKPAIVIWSLAAAAGLYCSHALLDKMNGMREEYRLTDVDPVENAPPAIAFTTVALGCFRGLLADALWLRTISLQDQGKYFEMVQLASWISKLQPRFSGATTFLSWNMAFNISVTYADPADRWRWIRNGMDLLREAIIYNPADPVLYTELAYYYVHKVSGIYDKSTRYYENELAMDLQRAFGGADPDWAAMAAAPDRVPEIEALMGSMEGGSRAVLLAAGFDSFDKLEAAFRKNGALPESLLSVKGMPHSLARAIDASLRRRWLADSYGIRTADVLELNKLYGTFDWRQADAQALYWADLGIKRARKDSNLIMNTKLMIEIVRDTAIRDSFKKGWIVATAKSDFNDFTTLPNIMIADAACATWLMRWEKNLEHDGNKVVYANLMLEAAATEYLFGADAAAIRRIEILRSKVSEFKDIASELRAFAANRFSTMAETEAPGKLDKFIAESLFRSHLLAQLNCPVAAGRHMMAATTVYEARSKAKVKPALGGMGHFDSMDFDRLDIQQSEMAKAVMADAETINKPPFAK